MSDSRPAAQPFAVGVSRRVVFCPVYHCLKETYGPDEIRTDCLSAERSPRPPAPRQQDRSRDARLPANAEAAQHDRAAAVLVTDGTGHGADGARRSTRPRILAG